MRESGGVLPLCAPPSQGRIEDHKPEAQDSTLLAAAVHPVHASRRLLGWPTRRLLGIVVQAGGQSHEPGRLNAARSGSCGPGWRADSSLQRRRVASRKRPPARQRRNCGKARSGERLRWSKRDVWDRHARMRSEGLTPSRAWTDRRTDRVWNSVPVRDRLTDQLSLVSPVPWEQDDFLRVKVEDEEASFSQAQKSNFGHPSHPEAARLRFRHFCFEEASNPREALARLREPCRQWLRPKARSKEQVLELLVLEQLLGALPPEIQARVRARCPESGEEAVALVEDLTQALDERAHYTEQASGFPGAQGGQ
ncbi:hypothetical protein J1605_017661 [Eschrichtius robustus]|uniref:SCAN box domain-containing protein n=1 Tax=Eschrichtius robustus TaxID=9764 RepID=A0AB34I016_ESCRO|nr:hypothetical protein J1605_017661 [Eschrichtius robustus]